MPRPQSAHLRPPWQQERQSRKSQRPTFVIVGAIISTLGAIFRSPKVVFFVSCDGCWPNKSCFWAALFTLLPFHFLPFILKTNHSLCRVIHRCAENYHQHTGSAFYFLLFHLFYFSEYFFTFQKLSLYLIIYTRAQWETFSAHL